MNSESTKITDLLDLLSDPETLKIFLAIAESPDPISDSDIKGILGIEES